MNSSRVPHPEGTLIGKHPEPCSGLRSNSGPQKIQMKYYESSLVSGSSDFAGRNGYGAYEGGNALCRLLEKLEKWINYCMLAV